MCFLDSILPGLKETYIVSYCFWDSVITTEVVNVLQYSLIIRFPVCREHSDFVL